MPFADAVARTKRAEGYKLTDAQAPVWSEAAQRHDVESPASVGAVLATAHRAHHDVVEIRCNTNTESRNPTQ